MKLRIHDTTLRDGEQATGNQMTLGQKLELAQIFDRMGIDIIEAGFAAASPLDFQAVQAIAEIVEKATVCVFARSKPEDIETSIRALAKAKHPELEIVVTTSATHLEARGLTRQGNLAQIKESVRFAQDGIGNVKVILEDATRANPLYLNAIADACSQAGAKAIVFADTVGIALPQEVAVWVRSLKLDFPDLAIGFHGHNDLGLATANTLAAIKAEADEVQVCVGGIGERSGNAALEEVVAAVLVRSDCYGRQLNVDATQLYAVYEQLRQFINLPLQRNKAIVGENSFSTTAGMHQSAMLKNPDTYEAIKPECFGRTRSFALSRHSGRAILRHRLVALGREPDSALVERLYAELTLGQTNVEDCLQQVLVSV
jgi:2-isopropylmalate synthase